VGGGIVKPTTSLREALSDQQLLGSVLAGDSWSTWRPMLYAVMGEPLTPDELEIFKRFTGRTKAPTSPIAEALFLVGRRGGKDRSLSVLATYLSALCDHRHVLAAGEKAVLSVIAPDQRQATVQLDYIEGCFTESPLLKQRMIRRTTDTIELDHNTLIEVRSALFRRIRGITSIGIIASEAAFWLSEGSSNPDTEILAAARPSLATTGGPLLIITSPHARSGEVWSIYDQHYGKDDEQVLVVQGSSRDFNPTLSEEYIARAYARDPAFAAAEYGGEFRTDIEKFISIEAVRACIEPGVRENAPDPRKSYIAFADPSGGSGDAG
jgi:hypothetical protein